MTEQEPMEDNPVGGQRFPQIGIDDQSLIKASLGSQRKHEGDRRMQPHRAGIHPNN
jgi:hypothetical protein